MGVLILSLALALTICILPLSPGMNVSYPGSTNSSACLTRFRTNVSHFRPCKKNVCFLFMSDVPYIILDPRMVAEDNQTLFRCKDRRTFFPDLGGISFNIKDALKPLDDALCVFAGKQCTFNGIVDFIAEHSNSTDGYRFGVTGLWFIIPQRLSLRSIPSVPIADGRMLLLGLRTKPPRRKNALGRMLSPFELETWLSIGGVLLVLLFLWLLTSCGRQMSLRFREVARNMVGDHHVRLPIVPEEFAQDLGVLREDIQLANRFAFNALKLLTNAFFLTTVLFYEIAVVYYVFEGRALTKTIDVQGLTKSELAKYIVTRDGAEEFLFRKSVDPDGKWAPNIFPWNRCKDLEDCYSKVLNRSHPAELVVTYDFAVRYHLKRLNACDRLVVYKTKRPFSTFYGVWYMNSNVPGELRNRVDRSLVTLRLEDKLRRIMARVVDDSTTAICGESSQKIPVDFLGPLFAVVLGPLVVIVLVGNLWEWISRCRIRARIRQFEREE